MGQTSSSDTSEVIQEQPQHAGHNEALSTPWSDRVRQWCHVNRGKEEEEGLSHPCPPHLPGVSSVRNWLHSLNSCLLSLQFLHMTHGLLMGCPGFPRCHIPGPGSITPGMSDMYFYCSETYTICDPNSGQR